MGIVMNEKLYQLRSHSPLLPSPFPASATSNSGESHLVARYITSIGLAPGVAKLITQLGVMVEGSMKSGDL